MGRGNTREKHWWDETLRWVQNVNCLIFRSWISLDLATPFSYLRPLFSSGPPMISQSFYFPRSCRSIMKWRLVREFVSTNSKCISYKIIGGIVLCVSSILGRAIWFNVVHFNFVSSKIIDLWRAFVYRFVGGILHAPHANIYRLFL